MSYVDRIQACNNAELGGYLPWHIEGRVVGWLRPAFAARLADWPEVFRVSSHAVELQPSLDQFAVRSSALREVCRELVAMGVIDRDQGEPYPVTPAGRDQALCLLDRASAPYFGIRTFGQHLNGFVREHGEMKMWLARRASDRVSFPGRLDQLVAGGLPHGLSQAENLGKECWEEAGIPAALAARARPVGLVSYCAEIPRGLKPDLLYCYDLELPSGFQPRCTDGEVEVFYLRSLGEVAEIVSIGAEFKPNCALVIIHFLIRHGYLTPEHADYLYLAAGLLQGAEWTR